MMMNQRTIQVDALESEAIHIFREVVVPFEKLVLLFLGGKDTDHNFSETIEFKDRLVAELGVAFIL